MLQVTTSLAELCSLLVDETYGELPSRIFSILLKKGRSTASQLKEYTAMPSRQLRHGLAVLQQHNLLYYHLDKPNGPAFYEANVEHAYNLVRVGKILEMVESTFGAPAKDVMQNLLLSGQTRVADLMAAYQEKIDRANNAKALDEELGITSLEDTDGVNGDSHPAKKSDLIIKSSAHLNSVICRLIEAELIDLCHAKTYETYDDIYETVEKEITATHFPGGVKGGKQKADYQKKLAEGLRQVRGESKSLKRKLEQNGLASKRRKIFQDLDLNGGVKQEEDSDPVLDPRQVIRVNYEKCSVELRSRRLVQFASDVFGDITSYVYGVLIKKITKDMPRCRLDPLVDVQGEDDEVNEPLAVSTDEILDSLKTSIDLSIGLGKPDWSKISAAATARVVEHAPKKKLHIEGATAVGDASSDEGEDSSDEEEVDGDYKPAMTNGVNGVNGMNGTKVPPKERKMDRRTQLRQHLFLLSESPQSFVRHSGPDEWTIDFGPVLTALRESELDAVIEETCGTQGLRLVHILRANGKLDEKALPNLVLMRKSDIQQKMLEMQRAGFVHVQEVPREPKADVKKSFFLWFCDVAMSKDQVLDTSYRAMVHCMQVLGTLREQEKDVLSTSKRTDVRGREQELMRKEYFERYSHFLKSERMLFHQLMKADELIAALRDY
ncbi:DNA-directed RNA polymerase III subunit RPC3 [Podospora australis]|uniref:DNA-directed RNA polymerase III subunit RPC3 n=1 Tax=Podospora australis TaxID=1536484 RepID=A0AAN6WT43_9PEZI|nr:DNA-directed RNA polymerase III subunit RPC3 [Podospora australis]